MIAQAAPPLLEAREDRRRRRLRQEMLLRAAVGLLILTFDHLVPTGPEGAGNQVVRGTALTGVLLNIPYYLAARAGRWPRAQAYARLLIDTVLITIGLGSTGRLSAGFLGVYTIVPLYAGLVFSSTACVVATAFATVCYVSLALLQQTGWVPAGAPPVTPGWGVAVFNLLILNIVGGLTALLAEAYRQSQLRLREANAELERAHAASLRLNAEIQRAAQLRALGEVVAGVAHELGNVLTLAAGHLSLARAKAAGAPVAAHLDQVGASFDSALRIIHNTLQTARQPAGGPVPVALAEVAQRVLDLKAYDLRRDEISVRVDIPAGFPAVRAQPYQLQQVLLNLLTNAQHALRQASPPREIAIVGRAPAGQVVLEVSDTGPGIASDVLPRLFEPFVTTKEGGTGLGLAISAGIVRELGGQIGAENRRPRGAVFRVTLPAAS